MTDHDILKGSRKLDNFFKRKHELRASSPARVGL